MNKEFWYNKGVLITGHTGFKGSWLCSWLLQMGAKVTGLSLKEPVSNPCMFSILEIERLIRDYRGDITNLVDCSSITEKTKPEILIHMAAQPLVRHSYSDPLLTYKTNVIGSANILEAARACDSIRAILVITTDKCYENLEQNHPYLENDSLGGYDPYSSSKACAEHVSSTYYRSFFKQKGVGLATARAGNVIGGGDWSDDRLIPDAVRAWSKNQQLKIRYPNAIRPWQHVIDPLAGYLQLVEHIWKNPVEYSGAWNFGPDHTNVNNVKVTIELASQFWGNSAKWKSLKTKHLHEAKYLQLNSEKAQTKLGWKPNSNFNDAVNKTINWYKEYYNGNQDMKKVTLNQLIEYQA